MSQVCYCHCIGKYEGRQGHLFHGRVLNWSRFSAMCASDLRLWKTPRSVAGTTCSVDLWPGVGVAFGCCSGEQYTISTTEASGLDLLSPAVQGSLGLGSKHEPNKYAVGSQFDRPSG